MNALAMWTPAFIIGYLLTLAVSITGSVMVGLAVYNVAKSKMSLNAVMWAMLVGILGWIPGIVYLCVRNKPLERIYACYSCGWGNPLSARRFRADGAKAVPPLRRRALLPHGGDSQAAKESKGLFNHRPGSVGAGGYRGNLHDSPYDPDRNGSHTGGPPLVTWALFT